MKSLLDGRLCSPCTQGRQSAHFAATGESVIQVCFWEIGITGHPWGTGWFRQLVPIMDTKQHGLRRFLDLTRICVPSQCVSSCTCSVTLMSNLVLGAWVRHLSHACSSHSTVMGDSASLSQHLILQWGGFRRHGTSYPSTAATALGLILSRRECENAHLYLFS